jgi:hypothetical protein
MKAGVVAMHMLELLMPGPVDSRLPRFEALLAVFNFRTLSAKCFPYGLASLRVLTSLHPLAFPLLETSSNFVLEALVSSLRYLDRGA